MLFRIKICGVTTPEDALLAAAADADAVGLNFYPKSPRFVDLEQAERIAAALPSHVARIGLFVNAPVDAIVATERRLRFSAVQIHGDEAPEFLAELRSAGLETPIVRAFRCGPDSLPETLRYLEQCERLQCRPTATLLDARQPGRYGGTGALGDWNLAASYQAETGAPPLVLAGGLGPENVGQAIASVRPAAVDTASGVESAPGVKDPALVQRFVAAACAAFES